MTPQDVKRQYTLQQWTSLIQECRSSGLSVRQWCAQNGIIEGSYYYWLKKIRSMAMETLPAMTSGNEIQQITQDKTVFTKISMPHNNNHPDITVSINGIQIGLSNTASNELIYSVLSVVKQLC